MSGKDFKVGEILIAQNLNELARNGMEVELIGDWQYRQIGEVDHAAKQIKTVEKECYQIKFPDGEIRNAQPHQLRRKLPPSTDINTKVSWEDCLWNPHKITEHTD